MGCGVLHYPSRALEVMGAVHRLLSGWWVALGCRGVETVLYPVRVCRHNNLFRVVAGYSNYVCIGNECRWVAVYDAGSRKGFTETYRPALIVFTRKEAHALHDLSFDSLEGYVQWLKGQRHVNYAWYVAQYRRVLEGLHKGFALRIGPKCGKYDMEYVVNYLPSDPWALTLFSYIVLMIEAFKHAGGD